MLDGESTAAPARWFVLESLAQVLAWRGHVKLDFAQHLELVGT
jgi:hypothetical protein